MFHIFRRKATYEAESDNLLVGVAQEFGQTSANDSKDSVWSVPACHLGFALDAQTVDSAWECVKRVQLLVKPTVRAS